MDQVYDVTVFGHKALSKQGQRSLATKTQMWWVLWLPQLTALRELYVLGESRGTEAELEASSLSWEGRAEFQGDQDSWSSSARVPKKSCTQNYTCRCSAWLLSKWWTIYLWEEISQEQWKNHPKTSEGTVPALTYGIMCVHQPNWKTHNSWGIE